MKPPPRARTKSVRKLRPELVPQRSATWQRPEQRKLLKALKTLRRSGGTGEVDYAYLRKCVHTRSVSELHSVVESLKNKVISCASSELRKKTREEKKVRKPIEVWKDMAASVAGTLEKPISTAFSQMLIVSSTEPCTLRNCDPPQVHRPPADMLAGRTVPLRPMPHLSAQAWPLPITKTPAVTMDPVVIVPNSKAAPPQQELLTTAGATPAVPSTSQSAITSCQPTTENIPVIPFTSLKPASRAVIPLTGRVKPSSIAAEGVNAQSVSSSVIQTTQQPSEQHSTTMVTTATSKSAPSSRHTSIPPVPSDAPSSAASSASHPMPPLSTSAAEFHTRFGRTSKHATKNSPRMLGVKCAVDFERIYRYLSEIHKPNEECHLTPMESAILLDLLHSLPEELPLLDCYKLHKHFIQVYQYLSSPADSKKARELFKCLKDGPDGQTEASNCQDGIRINSQRNTGGKKLQAAEAESQSSVNKNTSHQSEDTARAVQGGGGRSTRGRGSSTPPAYDQQSAGFLSRLHTFSGVKRFVLMAVSLLSSRFSCLMFLAPSVIVVCFSM